jgi:hypothetical protein
MQEYLRVLNELISDFDELLDKPEFRQVVLFSEPEFVNLLRSPAIDSQPGGPVRQAR